jgi:hypothetical protein
MPGSPRMTRAPLPPSRLAEQAVDDRLLRITSPQHTWTISIFAALGRDRVGRLLIRIRIRALVSRASVIAVAGQGTDSTIRRTRVAAACNGTDNERRARVLLADKNAIIYGAGGIGGGVARTFAREGARVFLAARSRDKLDRVARDIAAAGGSVEVAVLDALDEQAVDEHARAVAARAGRIDVSFNLISRGNVQGIPLAEMTAADFTRAIVTGITAHFITARAAARHMIKQGSGVILGLTAARPIRVLR